MVGDSGKRIEDVGKCWEMMGDAGRWWQDGYIGSSTLCTISRHKAQFGHLVVMLDTFLVIRHFVP